MGEKSSFSESRTSILRTGLQHRVRRCCLREHLAGFGSFCDKSNGVDVLAHTNPKRQRGRFISAILPAVVHVRLSSLTLRVDVEAALTHTSCLERNPASCLNSVPRPRRLLTNWCRGSSYCSSVGHRISSGRRDSCGGWRETCPRSIRSGSTRSYSCGD